MPNPKPYRNPNPNFENIVEKHNLRKKVPPGFELTIMPLRQLVGATIFVVIT